MHSSVHVRALFLYWSGEKEYLLCLASVTGILSEIKLSCLSGIIWLKAFKRKVWHALHPVSGITLFNVFYSRAVLDIEISQAF